MRTPVREIHDHPLRPPGFAEPLFLAREHKKEIAEHLAGSPWLEKASEAFGERREGGRRRCHVLSREAGGVFLVDGEGRGGCRRRVRKRRVGRVLERWREVSGWWETERGGVDRLCFRLLLSGGAVVEVAFDRRRGGWLLLGVLD